MAGLVFANLAATAAILFIFLFRKIFIEKVYPKVFVLLWMLVVLRLLLPFEFSSGISLYSFEEEKQSDFPKTEIVFEEGILPEEKIPLGTENTFSEKTDTVKARISAEKILFFVWISGSVLTGCFFAAKHFYLVKKLLKNSVTFEEIPQEFKNDNIRFYKSKTLCSPLSYGVFKPVIILPEEISAEQLRFVLLHEHTHIKDRDSVLKMLALFALALNWFNPFVWFMVKMLERDIERYCDERVLKKLGGRNALFYANTILDFAERESLSLNYFSAASLCERVTSIMENKNKKQSYLKALLVFTLAVLLMTACGTSPKEPETETDAEDLNNLLQQAEDKTLACHIYIDVETGELLPVMPYDNALFYPFDAGKIKKVIISDLGIPKDSGFEIICVKSRNSSICANQYDKLLNAGFNIRQENDSLIISVDEPLGYPDKDFGIDIFADLEKIEIVSKAQPINYFNVPSGDELSGSIDFLDIPYTADNTENSGSGEDIIYDKNVIAEMPSVPEDMQGYIGEEPPPNNYVFESFTFSDDERIERIIVKGFGFSKEASINVICIPSDETKISVGYGNELREAGFAVSKENGNALLIATKEEVLNISESFDLRIWADFEKVSLEIENFGYVVYEEAPEEKLSEKPEKTEKTKTEDLGIKFVSPVENGFIASRFQSYKGHTGMDIGSEAGTKAEIFAAANGTVFVSKKANTGYGNYIVIDHGGGIQSAYAHCSELFVKPGQKVKAGEVIAKMGSTGNSTGIHLHFELRHNGIFVDPEEFISFE